MKVPTPSRLARIRKGMTLEKAARCFGVKPATLAMWERNQTRWAWRYRRALEGARFYECSVNMFKCCADPTAAPLKKRRAAVTKQRRAERETRINTDAIVSR